jgi:hypothetical protein
MNERDIPAAREPEPSLGELVESVTRKIVTALVIAGGLIGLGLWSRSGPRSVHYQIVAAEGRIYRVNTQTGTVVGCQGERCAIVLHRHQEFEDNLESPPAPKQIAPPQPAPAPAPAPTPAQAPATQ